MERERQWLACGLAAAVLVAAGSSSVGRPARAAVPGGMPVQAAGPHRLFLPFALQSVVPHLVRIGQLGGATYAVAYSEPYVYVASGPRLLTVDVGDGASPRIVGQSDVLPGYVSDIDLAGEYLLVEVQVDASQGDDLLVVDVSDRRQPVVAGAIPLAHTVVEFAVVGTRAYIATSDGSLFVFDVSDPIHPSAIGRASFGDHIVGLAAGPRYVVTSSYLDDMEFQTDRILDVADPAHIVAVGSWLRGDSRPAFAFVGDHLYAADPSANHPHTDVGVVDVRVPANARLVGEVTVDGEVMGAEVWRGALYLASFLEAAGDYVVDVREPARPTVVGQIGARHEPGWVHAGSYAFAARSWLEEDSVSVLDLSDPLRPLVVGRFADLSNPSAVAGDGEHIYVADCSGGLEVLRVER